MAQVTRGVSIESQTKWGNGRGSIPRTASGGGCSHDLRPHETRFRDAGSSRRRVQGQGLHTRTHNATARLTSAARWDTSGSANPPAFRAIRRQSQAAATRETKLATTQGHARK